MENKLESGFGSVKYPGGPAIIGSPAERDSRIQIVETIVSRTYHLYNGGRIILSARLDKHDQSLAQISYFEQGNARESDRQRQLFRERWW